MKLKFSTVTLLLIAAVASANAQTLTTLYTFKGLADGGTPLVGLVRDGAGNFYGTTFQGGTANDGTVFKLSTNGTETVLHSFKGGPDGFHPYAGGLVRDLAGNLYGTTEQGGSSNEGTVFKVDKSGNESILYNFTGTPDGAIPYGGLVRDKAGNLYGTTYFGGTSNNGSVFKIDTTNKESILHSFAGSPSDGAYSYATLRRDALGNLYGTNYQGGATGNGAVFKISSTGGESVLYSFKGYPDGQLPYAGVVQRNGFLYGTTVQGGKGGLGTVFKVDKKGNETILYNFTGGLDGGLPLGGVIFDSAGNLYGTTYIGGTFGVGTVYKLDPTGKETVLYNFTGGADGKNPYFVVLVRDQAGNLYGTTSDGAGTGCGGTGCGTVFKLTP
jgi:uncharacterized repeat protein (TIGR03803 family)